MADQEDVYCTLVMNDAYLPGAAVLSHSLRDAGTTKKLACLVTTDSLRASTLDELRTLYNYVIPVPRIGNPSPKNLYLMDRADLLFTFTKINLWRQTQFRKIVYIDADVVALRAPEELFDITDNFAAAPDVGWPDIFNSGVMVIAPDEGDYRALQNMAAAGDSFDGADQGLLNQYYEYKPWKRLSFAYNCTPSANYQYEPAYRYYKRNISMLHFIGSDKPWKSGRYSAAGGASNAYQESLSRWWSVYDRHINVSPSEYIDGVTQTQSANSASFSRGDGSVAQSASLSATGYPAATTRPAPAPEASTISPRLPLAKDQDKRTHVHGHHSAVNEQKQPFSAPRIEWDATRAPPPMESNPEAANFPSHRIYEFNTDRDLFHAPARYPEPPKDMWFEVPKDRPRKAARPAPIFPWEERQLPKPTRRFADDDDDDDEPEVMPQSHTNALDDTDDGDMDFGEFEVNNDEVSATSSTPTIIVSDTSRDAYGVNNKNAWDEVSGIENYVRALTSWQKNRGNIQVVHTDGNTTSSNHHDSATTHFNDDILETLQEKVNERRESLILTDFPSAIERPSLPVTPAPRRRTTFWGQDDGDDNEGKLPSAHGVPNQADWNPAEQLEQLRKNSLIGAGSLKLASTRQLPARDTFPTAVPIPEEVLNHPVAQPLEGNDTLTMPSTTTPAS